MKYAKIEIEDKTLFVQTDAKRKERDEKTRAEKSSRCIARARPLFSAEVFRHPGKESLYNSLSWLPFSI